MDTIIIDIAVLGQEFTNIELYSDNSNVINLDDININEETFKTLFYPYGENFGIDPKIAKQTKYEEFISFLPIYRKVNGKKFFLLENIIKNIEADLNISRACFTPSSLVELSNDIGKISSFCDMNCYSVEASLPWSVVENILNNYNNSNITEIKKKPIFVISVVFKTPTIGVKNTIIKFHYKII